MTQRFSKKLVLDWLIKQEKIKAELLDTAPTPHLRTVRMTQRTLIHDLIEAIKNNRFYCDL